MEDTCWRWKETAEDSYYCTSSKTISITTSPSKFNSPPIKSPSPTVKLGECPNPAPAVRCTHRLEDEASRKVRNVVYQNSCEAKNCSPIDGYHTISWSNGTEDQLQIENRFYQVYKQSIAAKSVLTYYHEPSHGKGSAVTSFLYILHTLYIHEK